MPVQTETPTQAQIDELRTLFVQKYEQSPPEEPFHPVDLERIKNDSLWCQRFLEMYDLNMTVALQNLWGTCVWRQQYGANDLTENNIRQDYLMEGGIFVRNRDIDGYPLLIFKTRLHNKSRNIEDIMRIVIYWIERTQREKYLTQMTIFFDMSGTGLSSLDVDFVKRIIETFKLYYPNALNYILVFELAWVLNAAFKVIKALLPPKAVQILKMATKKDINSYVDKTNCLTSWGGIDDYEFNFVPEKIKPKLNAAAVVSSPATVESNDNTDKKVHFANNVMTRTPDALVEFKELHTPIEHMLRIDPEDSVYFSHGDSNESGIKVTSISKIPITFKIQTTSPEKFRVRPRCGVLAPNESMNIGILLKSEHKLSDGSKDKFLVMCMSAATTDCNASEIADLWKNKPTNSYDVEQHRLVCKYKDAGGSCGGPAKAPLKKCDSKVVSKENDTLKRLKFNEMLQYVLIATVILLSAALFYVYSQIPPSERSCPHKDKIRSCSGK